MLYTFLGCDKKNVARDRSFERIGVAIVRIFVRTGAAVSRQVLCCKDVL